MRDEEGEREGGGEKNSAENKGSGNRSVLPEKVHEPLFLLLTPLSPRPDRNNLTQPRVNIATDPWKRADVFRAVSSRRSLAFPRKG